MEEKAIDKKYTEYIDNLVEKIIQLSPEDVNKLQQDYLVNNMKKAANLLASSMEEDNEFGQLDFDEQCFYIQVMTEWSFHKEIDLFRSGIPAKYWKVVMQKIWYTIWEVMYACVKNEAPQEVVLSLVERFVNRTYNDAVEELKECAIIDDETEEKAKEQSNIEVMAQEFRREHTVKRSISNIITYLILFLIIGLIVTFVIIKFKTVGIIVILTFLVIYHIIPHHKEN